MSRWSRSVLVLAVGAALSCNAILGNEEGELDPDRPSGTSGASTTGGKSGGGKGGSTNTSGRGGTGVVPPTAGTGAEAGGGFIPEPPVGETMLGAPCSVKADCNDPNAPGLICISPTQGLLNGGAPAQGLCTAACELDDPFACSTFGANAVCWSPETSSDALPTSGYCVESCTWGDGTMKCHDRTDFACLPAFIGIPGLTCSTHSECELGEQCIDGSCTEITTACLPACGGDPDCAPGWFCDQSFGSGTCVKTQPLGLELGAICSVSNDLCKGYCQADAAGSDDGHCMTICGLGNSCGYNSDTGYYQGVCLTFSYFFEDARDAHDFGFCSPSCNCTDECYDLSTTCLVGEGGLDASTYANPGLCLSPEVGEELGLTELFVCDGDGPVAPDPPGG
jgi:hypothetical protein